MHVCKIISGNSLIDWLQIFGSRGYWPS